MAATRLELHELPLRCHVVLPGLPAGANVALCVRGQTGVRITPLNLGETEAAQVSVRAFNASLGISARAERAMLAGCLLGWTRASAEPQPGRRWTVVRAPAACIDARSELIGLVDLPAD